MQFSWAADTLDTLLLQKFSDDLTLPEAEKQML